MMAPARTPHPIGAILRRLMADRGMTVGELARRAGMGQPNVSRVLAGRHQPRPATLRRILDALGCSEAEVYRAGLDAPGSDVDP